MLSRPGVPAGLQSFLLCAQRSEEPGWADHLTVTIILAGIAFGPEPAVIVAVPGVKPVKRTSKLVVFAGSITVEGTATAAGLLELKLTARFVETGAERVSVTFWEFPAPMITLLGKKFSPSATCTCWLTAG